MGLGKWRVSACLAETRPCRAEDALRPLCVSIRSHISGPPVCACTPPNSPAGSPRQPILASRCKLCSQSRFRGTPTGSKASPQSWTRSCTACSRLTPKTRRLSCPRRSRTPLASPRTPRSPPCRVPRLTPAAAAREGREAPAARAARRREGAAAAAWFRCRDCAAARRRSRHLISTRRSSRGTPQRLPPPPPRSTRCRSCRRCRRWAARSRARACCLPPLQLSQQQGR